MSDWQPINTVPRDDAQDILVARLDPDGSYWCATAQWWEDRFAFMLADGRSGRFPILLCFKPTHWKPLPAPPPMTPSKDTV